MGAVSVGDDSGTATTVVPAGTQPLEPMTVFDETRGADDITGAGLDDATIVPDS